jgi:hypothetical protein
MMPGETALTRMPREAYSTASDRVAEARPPLVSAARTEGVLEFAYSAIVAEMLTDVEMLQAVLGLGAPVPVGGHLHLAQAVELLPHPRGCQPDGKVENLRLRVLRRRHDVLLTGGQG